MRLFFSVHNKIRQCVGITCLRDLVIHRADVQLHAFRVRATFLHHDVQHSPYFRDDLKIQTQYQKKRLCIEQSSSETTKHIEEMRKGRCRESHYICRTRRQTSRYVEEDFEYLRFSKTTVSSNVVLDCRRWMTYNWINVAKDGCSSVQAYALSRWVSVNKEGQLGHSCICFKSDGAHESLLSILLRQSMSLSVAPKAFIHIKDDFL